LGAVSGLFGLAAILLAAMGAHLIELSDAHVSKLWDTALQIHLFNTAAMLALTAIGFHRPTSALPACGLTLGLGTLIFSGSLYLRAAGLELLPTSVAPVGGIIMMASWLWMTALLAIK